MKIIKTASALFLAVATTVLAQQDAPPVNADAILKELQLAKAARQNTVKSQLGNMLQTVNSAAASGGAATDLYLQAVRAVQYEGENNGSTQFQDWKTKQYESLKNKYYQQALHVYLVYLSLTLQSTAGMKTADLLPSLVNYTGQALQLQADLLEVSIEESINPPKKPLNQNVIFDLLKKPLNESVIVRGFGVTLAPAGDWVMSPWNVDDMYQKVILPPLREKHDPAAVEYWNRRIEREAQQASSSKRTFDAERFMTIRKPELLWSRALEYCQIGQKNRGITEMIAIIKGYPAHPEAENWVSQIEGYLGKK